MAPDQSMIVAPMGEATHTQTFFGSLTKLLGFFRLSFVDSLLPIPVRVDGISAAYEISWFACGPHTYPGLAHWLVEFLQLSGNFPHTEIFIEET